MAGGVLGHGGGQLAEPPCGDGAEQILLVGEVAVTGGVRHARQLGQLTQAQCPRPHLIQELEPLLDQRLPEPGTLAPRARGPF